MVNVSETRLEMQQTQKLSQSMQMVIHLLSLDLNSLSEFMIKATGENPALEYVPPKRSAFDYAVRMQGRMGSGGGNREGAIEAVPAVTTAMEDLEQQLRLSELDRDVYQTALQMLWTLTPRGYFTTGLGAFAAEVGVSHETAKKALAAVQSLEPPGIGARNVEECLELQLRAKADVDPLCFDLVRIYLLEIGKGDLRQIAKETGTSVPRVRRCVEVIKSLTPAPCSLREEPVQYIVPEFAVEVDVDGHLTIQFYSDYYPTFRQDENFRKLTEVMNKEDAAYAHKLLRSASQILRAIDMRQSTMEKVARIIVERQQAFFRGQYSLLPLRIDAVAKELGVHETTVYRTIQNKYLYCARGIFPLSHFFQRDVTEGNSADRIKDAIRTICSEDDKLSDQKIADALDKQGIRISRRTVAKYRAQMEIGSSYQRKE